MVKRCLIYSYGDFALVVTFILPGSSWANKGAISNFGYSGMLKLGPYDQYQKTTTKHNVQNK